MKIRKERTHVKKIKSVLKSYLVFYNKNLKKKHIIIYTLSLLFFFFLALNLLNSSNETNQFLAEVDKIEQNSNIFKTIIMEKIPIVFLLIFSGVTPYIYIPVLGIIGYPLMLATQLVNVTVINIILVCLGAIIQIFGISLAVAAGIYYCKNATKRFRYNQSISLGMDDIREQIYEATKKEKELKIIQTKKQNKVEKREKLNVKIEYKYLMITAIISMIIVATAALITGV